MKAPSSSSSSSSSSTKRRDSGVSHDESIKFYNERIKSFQAERTKVAHYVSLIKPNAREQHLLQWETTTRPKNEATASGTGSANSDGVDDAWRQVQAELAVAKADLDATHQALHTKQAQIDRLKALPQPVERDVTYLFDDKYSSRVTRPPPPGTTTTTTSGGGAPHPQPKSSLMKIAFNLKTVDKGPVDGTLPPAPAPSSSSSSLGKLKTGEVAKLETAVQAETARLLLALDAFHARAQGVRDFINRTLDQVWVYGCMDVWAYGVCEHGRAGAVGAWVYGCMRAWVHGCMGVWVHGWTCLEVSPSSHVQARVLPPRAHVA